MNAVDELLREFAPISEDDATERVADEVARRRVRRAIADERRPRPRWRFVLPGAVAGGLAALILAIIALLPGHESSAPEPASAATVLEHAARVATQRVPAAYPGPPPVPVPEVPRGLDASRGSGRKRAVRLPDHRHPAGLGGAERLGTSALHRRRTGQVLGPS